MGAKYSLVDVVVCITGQRSDNAHRAFNDVLRIHADITHLVGDVNLVDSLGRRHQAKSPVAEIQTVLRVRKVDGRQVFARGRRGVHNGPAVRQRTQSN